MIELDTSQTLMKYAKERNKVFFKLVRYSEMLQYINVTKADPFLHLQESIPFVLPNGIPTFLW